MPLRALKLIVATGFGSGYSPLAPGTAGSAVGVALYWLLGTFGDGPTLLVTGFVIAAGYWSSGIGETHFGRHDPGHVVVDEVAGQMVALAWVPRTPELMLASFLIFRAMDIVKPYPARAAEALPGGIGIMTDDLVAGLYANLVLQLALYLT